MTEEKAAAILASISDEIEISRANYELAEKRYLDIGEWLGRSESSLTTRNPRVFSQGSFRLGTAIKPINAQDEYDLDLVINLEEGVHKDNYTQENLKSMVRDELERYRLARGIENAIEEKHRCWRLNYKDTIQFHMDILPSIPESKSGISKMASLLSESGLDGILSEKYAETTLSITDDRSPTYTSISDDWDISNPEGFAIWFKSQMQKAQLLMEERAQIEKVASVEELPAYAWGSPLQKSVQVLKRHRDLMFNSNQDIKPISVIITTLAAHAYGGENSIALALDSILQKMGTYVSPTSPRIPNPVDPQEDFADRWSMQEGKVLQLEKHFWQWLEQAKSDLMILKSSTDPEFISEQAMIKYGADVKAEKLAAILPTVGAGIVFKNESKEHKIVDTAKPWGE